jgi:hypothetical protein
MSSLILPNIRGESDWEKQTIAMVVRTLFSLWSKSRFPDLSSDTSKKGLIHAILTHNFELQTGKSVLRFLMDEKTIKIIDEKSLSSAGIAAEKTLLESVAHMGVELLSVMIHKPDDTSINEKITKPLSGTKYVKSLIHDLVLDWSAYSFMTNQKEENSNTQWSSFVNLMRAIGETDAEAVKRNVKHMKEKIKDNTKLIDVSHSSKHSDGPLSDEDFKKLAQIRGYVEGKEAKGYLSYGDRYKTIAGAIQMRMSSVRSGMELRASDDLKVNLDNVMNYIDSVITDPEGSAYTFNDFCEL